MNIKELFTDFSENIRNFALYNSYIVNEEIVNCNFIRLINEQNFKDVTLALNHRNNLISLFNSYEEISNIFLLTSLYKLIEDNKSKVKGYEKQIYSYRCCESEKIRPVFEKFYEEYLKKNNVIQLTENQFKPLEIKQDVAEIYFSYIADLIQNYPTKSIKDSDMFLQITLLLELSGRLNISAKMDRWNFYKLGTIVVQLLNKHDLTQKARDLSEQLFILSIRENLPHYGFYIQYKCYLGQKNIQDTLFYLCCFIENNTTKDLNFWLDSLLSTQIIFRDFGILEYEEKIFNFLITNYKENIENRDYLQLNLTHFYSQLQERKININCIEKFLDSNKEKIYSDGLSSFVAWYILLKQTFKIDKSTGLINYLNNFYQFIGSITFLV